MWRRIKQAIPLEHKLRVRRWIKGLDRRRLSQERLRELLGDFGMTPGRAVLLHTSSDEIQRRVPDLGVGGFIRMAQELVGAEGTLLLPTFPFSGTQHEFAAACRGIDLKRTPSQVGLITEVFRRLPGVVRSMHPTHPVAAWGKHAQWVTRDHRLGTTFGETSPFQRLLELDGLIVSVGCLAHRKYTMVHVPEEMHEPSFEALYEKEPRVMTVTSGEETVEFRLRVVAPGKRLDYRQGFDILEQEGVLRRERHGGLLLSSAPAGPFVQRSLELLQENRYYTKAP